LVQPFTLSIRSKVNIQASSEIWNAQLKSLI